LVQQNAAERGVERWQLAHIGQGCIQRSRRLDVVLEVHRFGLLRPLDALAEERADVFGDGAVQVRQCPERALGGAVRVLGRTR
jgi:hypothetical protein